MLTTFYYFHLGAELFFFQLAAETLYFIFAQRNHNLADLLVTREDPQRVDDNGDALNLKELFCRNTFFPHRRHARAKTCCRVDDNDLHTGVRSITTLRDVWSNENEQGSENRRPAGFTLRCGGRSLIRWHFVRFSAREHFTQRPLDSLSAFLDDPD